MLSDGTLMTMYEQNEVYYLRWIYDNIYMAMVCDISEDEMFKIIDSIQWR